jgi:hypothetical protein
VDVDADVQTVEESIEEPAIITVTAKIGDGVHSESIVTTAQTDQAQATAIKTPKVSNNKQSKRLLRVSGTASSQKKKELDPFAIMSRLSGSPQELGSGNQVIEKMYELEKSYKSEELKLKGRELAILQKKSETKLNLLKKKRLTITTPSSINTFITSDVPRSRRYTLATTATIRIWRRSSSTSSSFLVFSHLFLSYFHYYYSWNNRLLATTAYSFSLRTCSTRSLTTPSFVYRTRINGSNLQQRLILHRQNTPSILLYNTHNHENYRIMDDDTNKIHPATTSTRGLMDFCFIMFSLS